ncbi:MAG: FAD-binding oxidoreductase [Chitinophagaceae bacterium]|nr:FAD-binding oxidoreductase [Chitinophagaceae bacterium]
MKVLILGQGIAGTWLSYWLHHSGVDVTVIDRVVHNSSSRVASGVINPVTGRQVVTTWQAEKLIPFAEESYNRIGQETGKQIIHHCGIMAFPPSEQMMLAYRHKIETGSPFVHPLENASSFEDYFRIAFGGVHIRPAFWIDLQTLLSAWRDYLISKEKIVNEAFDESLLEVTDKGVVYKNMQADYIFYCNGIHASVSKFWKGLPFSFNKGEALIVKIPGLPHGQIYKFGISTLVPWYNNTWWAGSSYDNHFQDELPTQGFRQKMEVFLSQTIKLPVEILDQIAAIRPASVERRPFAGLHPRFPRVGILGGLGTKGVSLAPWLGSLICDQVCHGTPPDAEVNVNRFRRAFDP